MSNCNHALVRESTKYGPSPWTPFSWTGSTEGVHVLYVPLWCSLCSLRTGSSEFFSLALLCMIALLTETFFPFLSPGYILGMSGNCYYPWDIQKVRVTIKRHAYLSVSKATFRRRPSHEPNRMLMSENKGCFSFAFDSAKPHSQGLSSYLPRDPGNEAA